MCYLENLYKLSYNDLAEVLHKAGPLNCNTYNAILSNIPKHYNPKECMLIASRMRVNVSILQIYDRDSLFRIFTREYASEKNEEQFPVFIKSKYGDEYKFYVTQNDTAASLISQFSKNHRIIIEKYDLNFNGITLEGRHLLKDYGITPEDSTIYLMEKPDFELLLNEIPGPSNFVKRKFLKKK